MPALFFGVLWLCGTAAQTSGYAQQAQSCAEQQQGGRFRRGHNGHLCQPRVKAAFTGYPAHCQRRVTEVVRVVGKELLIARRDGIKSALERESVFLTAIDER